MKRYVFFVMIILLMTMHKPVKAETTVDNNNGFKSAYDYIAWEEMDTYFNCEYESGQKNDNSKIYIIADNTGLKVKFMFDPNTTAFDANELENGAKSYFLYNKKENKSYGSVKFHYLDENGKNIISFYSFDANAFAEELYNAGNDGLESYCPSEIYWNENYVDNYNSSYYLSTSQAGTGMTGYNYNLKNSYVNTGEEQSPEDPDEESQTPDDSEILNEVCKENEDGNRKKEKCIYETLYGKTVVSCQEYKIENPDNLNGYINIEVGRLRAEKQKYLYVEVCTDKQGKDCKYSSKEYSDDNIPTGNTNAGHCNYNELCTSVTSQGISFDFRIPHKILFDEEYCGMFKGKCDYISDGEIMISQNRAWESGRIEFYLQTPNCMEYTYGTPAGEDNDYDDYESNYVPGDNNKLNLCNENGVKQSFQIIGYLLFALKIAIPLILIGLGILDFSKALISEDDKVTKETAIKFAKRIISGVIIFFIPTILNFIFSLVDGIDETASKYEGCTACLFNPMDETKCSFKKVGTE